MDKVGRDVLGDGIAGRRESVGGSGQLWFADPSTGDGRERSAGVTSRASDG